MTEENTLDNIDFAPPGFKVSPGWRVGHLREETFTKSGLLVPAGSEKTSEALPLIDVDSGNQFWAVASGAWKFIWPPTGKVVLAVRESQIIAELIGIVQAKKEMPFEELVIAFLNAPHDWKQTTYQI